MLTITSALQTVHDNSLAFAYMLAELTLHLWMIAAK